MCVSLSLFSKTKEHKENKRAGNRSPSIDLNTHCHFRIQLIDDGVMNQVQKGLKSGIDSTRSDYSKYKYLH